jgi:hypothetical protein
MNGGPIITFPFLMTRADFFIRAPVRGLSVIVQVRHCLHRCYSKDRLWVGLTGIFRADAGADTPIKTVEDAKHMKKLSCQLSHFYLFGYFDN